MYAYKCRVYLYNTRAHYAITSSDIFGIRYSVFLAHRIYEIIYSLSPHLHCFNAFHEFY